MPITEPKKPRRREVPVIPTENLVTEIVDQITRKQDRAVKESAPKVSPTETCDFCLEGTRGLPYRVVLKCAGEEPAS